MNTKNIMIAVVVAVLVGAASFFGGVQYQKSKVVTNGSARGGNGQYVSGQRGDRQGGQGEIRSNVNNAIIGNGGAFESGEIISKDDSSITIKMRDGSSKIVYFSGSTNVGKTVDGASSDLQVGQNVMVNGTTDSSGAITAKNIQIRPSQPIQQ